MKIIYYSPHPTHDIISEVGYATHQRETIKALRGLGHEVITLVMGGDTDTDHLQVYREKTTLSPLKAALKKLMPRFIWTSLNNYKLMLHDRRAGQRLEEYIAKYQPGLVYERSEYLQDSGAKATLRHGVKYFLEVNAPFVEEMDRFEGYSLFHARAHKVEAYKLARADKVFCVSSSLTDFLVKRYHCERSKIIIQPNCIDPAKLANINPLSVRRELKIQDASVIGFVGSIFPYHGVDLLIKGFAEVHGQNPRTCLLIVGDGAILQDLKAMASDLGISDKVIFTGKIPHNKVFDYMAAMDICVMARSNWYGSPVKIFEYGLVKKPVIAPDTGPVRDVMEHYRTGLITRDNKDELVTAIHLFLNDKALAESCAENFHREVVQNYTWQKAAQTIIDSCA